MQYLTNQLASLSRRLRLANTHSKMNMQFALIVVLMLVQIAQILIVSGSDSLLQQHRLPWFSINLIAFAASVLLIAFRLPLLDEATRSEAIGEYINDGLLFVERDHVAFANTLALRLINGGRGRALREGCATADLSPEVRSTLDQATGTPAPIPFEAVIEGRKRHFFVSQIRLPRSRASSTKDDHRQVYVFQDVTFLRENEEAKVNFIGTLSHEIKTPITSLTMALGMLERIGHDPELVRIANSDVSRLRTLLEDLLNISKLKIVGNPNALSKQETNLTALVQQSVKAIAVLSAEKKVHVGTSLQTAQHVIANIDPTKISWVLTTLLNDAIRQTTSGGRVAVTLDYVDNQGIIDMTYERRLDSIGPAGYTIVRDIIEAHAGRFVSTHGPGNHSSFKFVIHARLKPTAAFAATNGRGNNETHLNR